MKNFIMFSEQFDNGKIVAEAIKTSLFAAPKTPMSVAFLCFLFVSFMQGTTLAQNLNNNGLHTQEANPIGLGEFSNLSYQVIFDSLDGSDRTIRIRFELPLEDSNEDLLGVVQFDKAFLPGVRVRFGTSIVRHSYLISKEDAQLSHAKIVIPLPLSQENTTIDIDIQITPPPQGFISAGDDDGGGLAIAVIVDSRSNDDPASSNKHTLAHGDVVSDWLSETKFAIGPCPANDFCIIHNYTSSDVQFQLLNLSGAALCQFDIPKHAQLELDISHFRQGVYLVQDVRHLAPAIRLLKL